MSFFSKVPKIINYLSKIEEQRKSMECDLCSKNINLSKFVKFRQRHEEIWSTKKKNVKGRSPSLKATSLLLEKVVSAVIHCVIGKEDREEEKRVHKKILSRAFVSFPFNFKKHKLGPNTYLVL